MNARDTIFKRLEDASHKVALPPRWQGSGSKKSLAEQFTEALRATHGEVYLEASLEAAKTRLGVLLALYEVSSAAANREAPLDGIGLQGSFPEVQWHRPPAENPTSEEAAAWRKALAKCDAGLTGAELLLAETGTLVVSSGPGKSRLVSLLPPLHIALVSTAQLVPDIFAWADKLTRPMPSNMVLISGPSKTGDIEQTLSVGVHGPKQLIAILFQEDA